MGSKTPNPGSAEAIERGCKCPVIDNHHGNGVPRGKDGAPLFWISGRCSMHMTDKAPLGPIKWNPVFYWQPGYQADDEGYELIEETWLDQYGNEYTSIEHVALCAVARALEVERG